MDNTMVDIALITVDHERFREVAPKAIEEMVVSFIRHGQLQPIIVQPNGNLLAGMHRLTAAKELGWTQIWADIKEVIDEEQAREIELEENIRRRQMTWLEQARGLAELDRLRKLKDPNWGQSQTAVVAGTHQKIVSESIKINRMIELFPELAEAKSLNQALSWATAKADSINRVVAVRSNTSTTITEIEDKIWLGDSVELIKLIPDESFNAIITDPPFGLDYDKRKAGTSGSMSAYSDDAESYRRILSMAPDMYRVLKPDGWLVFFFGMSWYEEVKEVFTEAGFTVDELPIVWNRSGGRCHTNRPDRYFTRGYDVALHAFKGNPQIIQRGLPNVITVDPIEAHERTTLVERPIELYAELINRLTVRGETVADFFVGGGGCPAAAVLNGRDYFGIELDEERRAYAIGKIKANTPD